MRKYSAVLARSPSSWSPASRPAPPSRRPIGKLDPKMVVAKVSGKPITAGELDEKIKPELRKLEAQYQERLHELRKGSARLE